MLDRLDKCGELKRACLEFADGRRLEPYVDASARLKGVGQMGAMMLVATTDDSSRFKNGRSSKRFGPAPTRHGSGEKVDRNGGITKADDTTVSRAVVEWFVTLPSWNKAQKRPAKGCEIGIAVEARLCDSPNVDRYGSLTEAAKRPNIAKVAVVSGLVR